MKLFYLVILFCLPLRYSAAQSNIDSLLQIINENREDSPTVNALSSLARYYLWKIPDSSIKYALRALPLAKKLALKNTEVRLHQRLGEALSGKGNFSLALETQLKGLKLAEQTKVPDLIAWSIANVGLVYFYSHDYKTALTYLLKTKAFPEIYLESEKEFAGFIGEAYFNLTEIDSAYTYISRAYQLEQKEPGWVIPYYYMGKIMASKKQYEQAARLYFKGLTLATVNLDKINGFNGIAEIYRSMKVMDSAIYYASMGLALSQENSFPDNAIESSSILGSVYKSMHIPDSAYKYQEIMLSAKDSLFNQEKMKQIQNLEFNEKLRQQQIKADQNAYKERFKLNGLLVFGCIFLIVALLLWRNNRHKQAAFNLLKQQKIATDREREKVEEILIDLRNTQAQLIQSEKMASLGELTAGIAHEIQNPLNFVNNFSEVNNELLVEIQDEIARGNFDEVSSLARDIKDNQDKINEHGRRAESIVKGMLLHSRSSSGSKELTDINKQVDEFLRLSYHGFRAKDKTFNAEIKTDYDPSVGLINVVPQEIGRVLLNLFNNAFYAVNEKKSQQQDGYEPTISVITKRTNDKVTITVKDNGNGIPQKVVDKIFQPFFTTKPAGQGTGLGLSLAYDIIKAHGGTIAIETKKGEGTEFIIYLPIIDAGKF